MQNSSQDISNFQVITLQPNLILMRHKQNRKTYRYVESKHSPSSSLSSPNLIFPLQLPTGFLYEAGSMALSSQIRMILKAGQKCVFDECEIVNTVEPVIKALQSIHAQGQIHGAICPDNIILDEFGSLKIYYPGVQEAAKFYYRNADRKPEDDFQALGIVILQLQGFQKPTQDQETRILNYLIDTQKYTQKFIFALLSLLRRKTKFLDHATQLLKDGSTSLNELTQEEKQFYDSQIMPEKIKKSEQSQNKRPNEKVQFTPPLVKHTEHTPKKMVIKKYVKAEDAQNRKYLQQSKKKKPSDHALKRVSNGKMQGENSNAPSPNYKKLLRDIKETKQRQDLLKMAVTIKRMRTVSKKKIG